MKDFDEWNRKKKIIDEKFNSKFVKEREIWWCTTGVNIGDEQNGKNSLFERPILILKKFNKNLVLGVFLTSKHKKNIFNFSLDSQNNKNAIVSQIRTISTKRLTRKIMKLGNRKFVKLLRYIKKIIFTLKKKNPSK